ncbi:MAG: hypothetical protein QMC67_13240 [Candidatus Wallbacteria bacterium]
MKTFKTFNKKPYRYYQLQRIDNSQKLIEVSAATQIYNNDTQDTTICYSTTAYKIPNDVDINLIPAENINEYCLDNFDFQQNCVLNFDIKKTENKTHYEEKLNNLTSCIVKLAKNMQNEGWQLNKDFFVYFNGNDGYKLIIPATVIGTEYKCGEFKKAQLDMEHIADNIINLCGYQVTNDLNSWLNKTSFEKGYVVLTGYSVNLKENGMLSFFLDSGDLSANIDLNMIRKKSKNIMTNKAKKIDFSSLKLEKNERLLSAIFKNSIRVNEIKANSLLVSNTDRSLQIKVDNFDELYSQYKKANFRLIRTKGYNPKYQDYSKDAYSNAKEPIEKNFTSSDFKESSYEEIKQHIENGGWLGVLIPKGYISLDIDKDHHSIDQALEVIKKRNYKTNLAKTKNGYHAYFKDLADLKGSTDVFVKHGYKLTYRAGGKNYVVVPPSDGREWIGNINDMDSLLELPAEFQPLNDKDINDLGRAVATQLRYCWKKEFLSGNDHIDMAFMGWLVKKLKYDFASVEKLFKMIYQDEYDENKTRINFERLPEIDAATGFKTLCDAINKTEGLSYLIELLNWFGKANDTSNIGDNNIKSCESFLSEEELGLNIIGYNSARKILIWNAGKIHAMPMTEINKNTYQLLTGKTVSDNKDNPKPWLMISKSIIDIAHKKGLVDENEKIKTGVWNFENNFFIISGLKVLKVDSKTNVVTELKMPVISSNEGKGKNILLALNPNTGWLNVEHFNNIMASEENKITLLKNTYKKLYDIISQWCWKSPEMLNYVTAAVMLTPLQQIMQWRPIIYLTGERNSGKTYFHEKILSGLFSSLTLRQDRTTAHSVLQTYGNTSHIMILDEFEKYKKIMKILEYLKMCGRGGVAKSGTPGEEAFEYKIKHMPWLSSTSPQFNDAAQVSRMIIFDLIKPADRKTPNLPNDEKLSELGTEIIAALIKIWPLLDEQYDYYHKNASLFECDSRMLENSAYMLAIQNIVTDVDKAKVKLPAFIATPIIEDRDNILNQILCSQININEGSRTIKTNITDALISDFKDLSQQCYIGKNYGIRFYLDDSYKKWLAINENLVKRYLLKDLPEYQEKNISTALLRIPGAKKNKIRLGNSNSNPQHCVLIPIEETPFYEKKDVNDNVVTAIADTPLE